MLAVSGVHSCFICFAHCRLQADKITREFVTKSRVKRVQGPVSWTGDSKNTGVPITAIRRLSARRIKCLWQEMLLKLCFEGLWIEAASADVALLVSRISQALVSIAITREPFAWRMVVAKQKWYRCRQSANFLIMHLMAPEWSRQKGRQNYHEIKVSTGAM